MFEKVNPSHPDKIADRIAGAIVDLAYSKAENPRIAVEVLVGHDYCTIIAEGSEQIYQYEVEKIVESILGFPCDVKFLYFPQDERLARAQEKRIRCGDNGIFKGMPVTDEQRKLTAFAHQIYNICGSDGKYIINGEEVVVCQSMLGVSRYATHVRQKLRELGLNGDTAQINPIGMWVGGIGVDTGATNRKLGSDMGDSVTGGGLHGKDLSKADVSVNIYAWLKAQETGQPVELCCAIGDEVVDGKPYSEIVEIARAYIKGIGGFEKFAEWGLIR